MHEVAETTNRRTHTDGTTTLTLAAHAHRGLITIIIVFVYAMAHGIVMEGLLSTDVKLTFTIIHVFGHGQFPVKLCMCLDIIKFNRPKCPCKVPWCLASVHYRLAILHHHL